MEALYTGLPIVTQEGALARSRWGAGMLRALGISEGIAASDEEYVKWAVRLAQDADLRQRLKDQIEERVQYVLFNGLDAQPAFEQALTDIYSEECRRAELEDASVLTSFNVSGRKKPGKEPLTVVTSLIPSHETIQQIAVQTWQDAGFHLVSVNALDDIALLSPHYPNVEFIAAPRDGRKHHGRSYIYFDDLLAYFQQRDLPICGIISPDLCLLENSFAKFVREEAPNSFLYGSRVEVDALSSSQGQMYNIGFDYFFFDREAISYYPKQDFCLELPWWDYWAVIVPLMRKMPVKQVTTPVTLHVKHPPAGDAHSWLTLGKALGANLKPPFALLPETMPRFANETLTIINKLSQQVSL